MRQVVYKNLTSRNRRRRIVSVSEQTEKGEFLTHTQKVFIYIVRKETEVAQAPICPEFYITKIVNRKDKTERFVFRIKGVLDVVKDGNLVKVDFCHSLRIDIMKKPTASSVESSANSE